MVFSTYGEFKNVVADRQVEKYHMFTSAIRIVPTQVRWSIADGNGDGYAMKKILVENIEDAMVLGRDVCGSGGNVLLTKGTVLSAALGRRLQNWGIPAVYVEGEEEKRPEENTVSVSPEELNSHLTKKFGKTLNNQNMQKIFNAVYHYRLYKTGK